MESVYAGWLSVVPPVVVIGLALITKQVILSLIFGIFSGALIYSALLGQNLLTGTITSTIQIMFESVDFPTLVLMSSMGVFIYILRLSGGDHALGSWAAKKVKGKQGALLTSAIVGVCLFISDVFHALSMGAICRPLFDESKIGREKLAYLIDATDAPVCCIAPVGTWAAWICACFPATTLFANNLTAFLQQIPYNIYCITCILMVFWTSFPNHDYGLMAKYEYGLLEPTNETSSVNADHKEGKIRDMLVPLVVFILGSVFFMLQTGGMWTRNLGFFDAMSNASTTKAIICACLVAIFVAFAMYVPSKTVSFSEFMNGIGKGVESMTDVNMLLVFAWALAGTCRNLLQIGDFMAHLIGESSFPPALLPAVFFVIACAFSFASGTSWGTFGVMLPLAFPVCELVAPHLIIVCISAILGGSVFGDHCSPISDTTILSSGIAGVSHIVHVDTQMPYALTSAAAAVVGYIVAGFTVNVFLTLAVSLVFFFCVVIIMSKRARRIYEQVNVN